MKSHPTQMVCKHCSQTVMLPPSTFQRACALCTFLNDVSDEKCGACAQPLRNQQCAPSTIVCTMCRQSNEVPTTNAEVTWEKTKKETSRLAHKAADNMKAEYEHLKSVPPSFNCEHCSTLLGNPNLPQPYLDQQPAQVRGVPSVPINSPQQQLEAPIERVTCSVCRKETAVPGSMFTHKMRGLGRSMGKSATEVMYSISDQKFASCPICKHPNKLPAPAPAPSPAPHPNSPPRPAAAGPPIRLELACERCSAKFPAVIQSQ